MNYRNPLANARGLGAAGRGFQRWWLQRVTAVALVPLTVWFVWSLAVMSGRGYESVIHWIRTPWIAIVLLLFLGNLFYHAQAGLREVAEDYVGNELAKLLTVLLIQFICALVGAAAMFSVLLIAIGGA